VIKSRSKGWAGHVARMCEGRVNYRVLVGWPEGKRPLGKSRIMWVANVKTELREIGLHGTKLIRLAQSRVQWRTFVNTVTNLPVP
jgi:hypothetical protein